MITERDLDEAIAECYGQRNPDAKTCLKLASFYTIKDHLNPKEEPQPIIYGYSGASEPQTTDTVAYSSDTEFGKIVKNIDAKKLMKAVDELAETIRVFDPRLYKAFIREISALK